MQRPVHAPREARGLVLLEALVAAAVLAVLATLAAPSFTALSERFKLRSAVQDLNASLYAARAEAVKRGGHVTLARRSGAECGGSNQWRCGWVVFADANESGTLDPGEDELLHTGQAPPGIDVVQTSNRAALRISEWGQFNGMGALGFVLCSRADPRLSSVINISAGGRVQTVPGTDGCRG